MAKTQDQLERAKTFRALHVPGDPVVLFNVWDAGTAQVAARTGARAIATGSWSVAAAHGYADGEKMPLELALADLERIVAAVQLPVTVDLESGYGRSPADVSETVTRAILAGAIGFNLEDRIIGESGLYSAADQSSRIRAARQAADRAGIPAFINARTDLFLKADRTTHDGELLDAALRRAEAYAQAGASGFFAPGLVDETWIERLGRECALPINILVLPMAPPAKRLTELGVARISHGPGPYRLAMRAFEDAAREAYASTRA
jgi:2-methylisocitrate lyase-like PEP mutase family enzyme